MKPALLVLRALGLGDMLTAVPAIRAIARAFPDHHRILAAPQHVRPIVDLCGGVDEVIDAAPLAPVNTKLPIDIAVNLHGKGPQSHQVLLQLQPRRLIAFGSEHISGTEKFPKWRADEHEIERWCRMLRGHRIAADPSDITITAAAPDERARGAILVHAGAASESRRWPVPKWLELCSTLRRQGQRVILTGSAEEFRRCRRIARAAHIPIRDVLAGQTDLSELTSLVAAARAVVCGDTGIAHVASALGTPSVVLFGPTSPHLWGPPRRRLHRVIWRGTLGDPHADYVDPGLASITVPEVLAELYVLMQMAAAG